MNLGYDVFRDSEYGTIPHPSETIAYVGISDGEWERMWEALAQREPNKGSRACTHPSSLDAWQYMGSRLENAGWRHSFRHRRHPETQARMSIQVPASEGWKP